MATSNRRFKDAIYEQFARLGKAIAAPKRLELLDLLCQGPRTVEALAEQAALSVANASQHLQVLRAARLVDAEKKGLYVEYRLADAGNGTRLTVVESGFAALPDDIRENALRDNTQGWDEQIENIRTYLEAN